MRLAWACCSRAKFGRESYLAPWQPNVYAVARAALLYKPRQILQIWLSKSSSLSTLSPIWPHIQDLVAKIGVNHLVCRHELTTGYKPLNGCHFFICHGGWCPGTIFERIMRAAENRCACHDSDTWWSSRKNCSAKHTEGVPLPQRLFAHAHLGRKMVPERLREIYAKDLHNAAEQHLQITWGWPYDTVMVDYLTDESPESLAAFLFFFFVFAVPSCPSSPCRTAQSCKPPTEWRGCCSDMPSDVAAYWSIVLYTAASSSVPSWRAAPHRPFSDFYLRFFFVLACLPGSLSCHKGVDGEFSSCVCAVFCLTPKAMRKVGPTHMSCRNKAFQRLHHALDCFHRILQKYGVWAGPLGSLFIETYGFRPIHNGTPICFQICCRCERRRSNGRASFDARSRHALTRRCLQRTAHNWCHTDIVHAGILGLCVCAGLLEFPAIVWVFGATRFGFVFLKVAGSGFVPKLACFQFSGFLAAAARPEGFLPAPAPDRCRIGRIGVGETRESRYEFQEVRPVSMSRKRDAQKHTSLPRHEG